MCLCSILQKLNEFVYGRHDTSVEQVDHPVGEARIVFGVCHHNNGGSFFVQFGQELHHFGSVFGVQVTGRLIGFSDSKQRHGRWRHAAADLRKAAVGSGWLGG